MNRNDMKRIVYFLVSLLGFTKLAAQDPADFVLPSIISDHAVMQRDAVFTTDCYSISCM